MDHRILHLNIEKTFCIPQSERTYMPDSFIVSKMDVVYLENYPHPRLSSHSKELRNAASGPKIPIIVGNREDHFLPKTFYVYKSLLVAHSPFFKAATSERWMQDRQHITLADDHPMYFEMFLQWMCSGDFNYLTRCLWPEWIKHAFEERQPVRGSKRWDEHVVEISNNGIATFHYPKFTWQFYALQSMNIPEITGIYPPYPPYQRKFIKRFESSITKAVEHFLDPYTPCLEDKEPRSIDPTYEDPFPDLGDPFETIQPRNLTDEKLQCSEKRLKRRAFVKRHELRCAIVDPKQILETLIKFYFFADRLDVSELCSRIVEEIRLQELFRIIDFDHIEWIYENTHAGSLLRYTVVDQVLAFRRFPSLKKPYAMSSAAGEFCYEFSLHVGKWCQPRIIWLWVATRIWKRCCGLRKCFPRCKKRESSTQRLLQTMQALPWVGNLVANTWNLIVAITTLRIFRDHPSKNTSDQDLGHERSQIVELEQSSHHLWKIVAQILSSLRW